MSKKSKATFAAKTGEFIGRYLLQGASRAPVSQDPLLNMSYPEFLEPLHFAHRVVGHLFDLPRVAYKTHSVNHHRGFRNVCAHNYFSSG